MSQSRLKSSKLMNLPSTRQQILRKQQSWKQYHRSVFSQQHQRCEKRMISTAPYQQDFKDNLLRYRQRPRLNIRNEQIEQDDQTQSVKFRPYTEMKKNQSKRLKTPLSVLRSNTKNNHPRDHLSSDNNTKSRFQVRVNFLRKGTSIDKAIIMNVLRSKFNLNVCTNTFSYTNDPRNAELIKLIEKQIPKGLRDIVGAEEMLRMSHVMTGAHFHSTNMTKQLNLKLKQRHKLIEQNSQFQDGMTLKSIKRW